MPAHSSGAASSSSMPSGMRRVKSSLTTMWVEYPPAVGRPSTSMPS